MRVSYSILDGWYWVYHQQTFGIDSGLMQKSPLVFSAEWSVGLRFGGQLYCHRQVFDPCHKTLQCTNVPPKTITKTFASSEHMLKAHLQEMWLYKNWKSSLCLIVMFHSKSNVFGVNKKKRIKCRCPKHSWKAQNPEDITWKITGRVTWEKGTTLTNDSTAHLCSPSQSEGQTGSQLQTLDLS